MLVLWEKDHITVSDIGAQLFLESSTLTPLLKKLESLQLLTRQRSKRDERQVIISLTDQGAQLKSQALDIPHQLAQASACDLDELMQLKSQLEALRTNISK